MTAIAPEVSRSGVRHRNERRDVENVPHLQLSTIRMLNEATHVDVNDHRGVGLESSRPPTQKSVERVFD